MKEQNFPISLMLELKFMKLVLPEEQYKEWQADMFSREQHQFNIKSFKKDVCETIFCSWLESSEGYFNTSPGSYIEGLYLWKEKASKLCGQSIIFLIFAGFLKQEWLITLVAIPLFGSVYIGMSIDWWLEQKRIFKNLIWIAIGLFFLMLCLFIIIFFSDPKIYKAAVIYTAQYTPYFPENIRVIGLAFTTYTPTILIAFCASLGLIYAIFGLVPGIYTSVWFFRKYKSKI